VGTNLTNLGKISNKVRLDVLNVSGTTGGGHLGGTFSCVDIIVNLFLGGSFSFWPFDNHAKDRDRFIFSKGHACLAYYSILFQKRIISSERLKSFATNGGLGAQLDTSIPFVDWNTGSLGHSIGICAGIAMAAKLDDKNYKAVTLIGDSELSEGASWEAIAFCGDNILSNVVVIIDRNRLTVTSRIDDDAIYSNLEEKMRSFKWNYLEINGHSHLQIAQSFSKSKQSNLPTMILANTIKGKGVSFMENNSLWHHNRPNPEQLELAIKEISRLDGVEN
jgi:transketolase